MSIGCKHCTPEEARAALKNLANLQGDATLVDEDHFRVRLLHCRRCGQRYLYAFGETIDWAGGNDPQSRILAPVTEAQAAALAQPDQAFEWARLTMLGAVRHVRQDWPASAEDPSYAWIDGPVILPAHD